MRRLLVFQHVAHEILGILDPLLREASFRIRYINFDRQPAARPRLDRYHGLIVLGGPMNCDQGERFPHLDTEIEMIQRAVDTGRPVLGICLGAQLIARALGARVRRNPVREIGWYDLSPTETGRRDPVFGTLAGHQRIFQWHGDTFDIPEHAVHLARSPDCENQAFRYGENVYGLQFHLEVDQPMIERWLEAQINRRELESLGGDPAARTAAIRRDTQAHIETSIATGRALFGRYLQLFHQRRRRLALPSR